MSRLMSDDTWAADEEVDDLPLPPGLAGILSGAMDLFVEAARVVHGPGPVEDKVAWVLARAGEATGATVTRYLSPDDANAMDTGVGGDGAVLRVPVPSADGRPHGVLVAARTFGEPFSADAVAAVEALAAHLGVALDNVATVQRLTEQEAARREVVHQLQEAVRPPMPPVPGTELGVYYLPADPSAPTGGDLYDWQFLPDGDLHVVVVDVLGKGVAATKDALAVTHVLRLLVLDGCPLERLVARADALVCAQSPDLVATLLVGRYSPDTGVLRLAGGGHPPLLLASADGAVRQVSAPGVPIGWPGAGTTEVVTVTLDRSDTAIFYTDGLVEATKDIIEGLENLEAAAAETAGYPAPHLARALVERALAGADRRDDTLALVLRRRLPPAEGGRPLGPFEYRFSPNAANVPLVRHFLEDWLERQPLAAPERHDLALVASELTSNAVGAASGRPGGLVLRARVEGDAVFIEVEDDGVGLTWPELPPEDPPDPDTERGRGLYLVRSLADEVSVTGGPGRTVITAVKRAVVPAGGGSAKFFPDGG